MAASDPMDGLEGTLYYCADENADESTVGAVWVALAYVTGFSVNRDRSERDVYNKRDKVCTKKGRNNFTGSISQLYTQYSTGVSKLFDDELPVALKLAVDKDLNGSVDETRYFSNVYFKNAKEDYGNLNDGGDVVMSCDFSFTECHTV
jgi:hypothetical protein